MQKSKLFTIIIMVGLTISIIGVKGDNYLIEPTTVYHYYYYEKITETEGIYIRTLYNSSILTPFEWITYSNVAGAYTVGTTNRDAHFSIAIYKSTNGTHITCWILHYADLTDRTETVTKLLDNIHFDSRLVSETSIKYTVQSTDNFTKYSLLAISDVNGGGFTLSGYGIFKITAGITYIDISSNMFERIMNPETFEDLMLFIILLPFTLMFHGHWFLFFFGLAIAFVELVIIIAAIRRIKEYLW